MGVDFRDLLPIICVAVFAFAAWLIFEIVAYFLRPGAAKELFFPGMPNDPMVTRRKRLLSLYEIYSPADSRAELKNESRRSFSNVISVHPTVDTIEEKIEPDLPPSYDTAIVLSVDNLPTTTSSNFKVTDSPPPTFKNAIHRDVECP